VKFVKTKILAVGVVAMWLVAFEARGDAVTFSTFFEFGGTNGAYPNAGLVQGTDGSFYGTTYLGGTNDNHGTVFRITTNATLASLVSFSYTNGSGLGTTLVQGRDGYFYGTAYQGGVLENGGYGTVFQVATNGALTNLFIFPALTNAYPRAGLVQGNDGNLYGTTDIGGTNGGYGTVFQITTNGTFTTFASFNNTNGAYPFATLIQANDGNFYGTTPSGGTNNPGYGTIFKLTTNGTITALVSFKNTHGTTRNGGTNGDNGTVFKLTTNGVLTTLISFNGTNGANPLAGLVQGSDDNFYGTTISGGTNSPGYGTIFKLTTNGIITTLVSFNSTNGATPTAGLMQSNDGNFYGTTSSGGANGFGTIFRFSIVPTPQPVIQMVGQNAGVLTFTWSAVPNETYQPQYSTNLLSTNWFNLGGVLAATNSSLSASDFATNLQRFYRVLLLP
jgi:uncharacterized repeat protein (TIGR03803 family)